MQNGLYVATSGMLMQNTRVTVIANNLANINTDGFKKDMALFTEYRPVDNRFPQDDIRKTHYNKTINAAVKLRDINTDFSQGNYKFTGVPLDVAIEDPNSFMTVQTSYGIRFTRDGAMRINSQGELVTNSGFNILGNTGDVITIPQNAEYIDITLDGTISVNGAAIGQIQTVTFNDLNYLEKVGRNLYSAVNVLPEESQAPNIRQNFLESSNVDSVLEMVQMIEALREFEMYQKAVHSYDSMNELAANQIGRI